MGIGKRISNVNALFDKQTNAESKQGNTESKPKDQSLISYVPQEPKYGLEELILANSIKNQLLDVAEYIENSRTVFEEWGFGETHKYSKRIGINLYGPPGTGKTMAAHAIARHMNRKILAVNYADIESKYVGETPKNIRKAFEVAQETKSILFFDEADAILSRRVTNMLNATDVSVNQTRSVLLMILNEYQDIVIFATNFIENFDPAFMRRISMHVKFELPDYDCRFKLWEKYIPAHMLNSLDIAKLASESDGLSGSDISNAMLMAAFKSARQHEVTVQMGYVLEMIQSIMDSKKANSKRQAVTTTREVSEEYVKQELAKK